MTTKKIASLILAIAMVFTMTAVAFADTYRLEGENADLTNVAPQVDPYGGETGPRFLLTPEGDAYAKSIFGDEASGEGLAGYQGYTRDQIESWHEDLIGESDEASNGQYLRQYNTPENVVKYTFNSSAAASAQLVFAMASDRYNWQILETEEMEIADAIAIMVNGEEVDIDDVVLEGYEDDISETAWTEVTLDVDLVEGENTIEIVVIYYDETYTEDEFVDGEIIPTEKTRTVTNGAPNIDYIDIVTDATVTF